MPTPRKCTPRSATTSVGTRFATCASTKEEKQRDDFLLSEALAVLKEGAIETCASCEKYVLTHHMHSYTGSMGKTYSLCPECDLPEKWSSKASKSRNRRFYIYFDPQTDDRWMQWGHPTKGNPFHIEGDPGCATTYEHKRKRQS